MTGFTFLVSVAFLRKIFFLHEITVADCIVVVFSLLVSAFIYWYTTERKYIESDDVKLQIEKLESKLTSEIHKLSMSIEFIEEDLKKGF